MPVTLTKQASITAALGNFLQAFGESNDSLPANLTELSERWTTYYQKMTGERVTCPLGTVRYYLRCRGVVVRRSGTLRWHDDRSGVQVADKPSEQKGSAVRHTRHIHSAEEGIAQIVSVLQQAEGSLPLCRIGGRVRWTRDQRFRHGRLTRFIARWPLVFESSDGVVQLTDEAQQVSQHSAVIAAWAVRQMQACAQTPHNRGEEASVSSTTQLTSELSERHELARSPVESFMASDSVRWADLVTSDEESSRKLCDSSGDETTEEDADDPNTPRSTCSDDQSTLVVGEPASSTYVREQGHIYIVSSAGHRPANGEYVQTPALSGGFHIFRKRIRGMRRPWQPYYLYCYPVDGRWYLGRAPNKLGDSGTEDFYVLSGHPSAMPECETVGDRECGAPTITVRTVHIARNARDD